MEALFPILLYRAVLSAGSGEVVRARTFADGTTGDVYVLDRMRGPVFARAITPEGFAEAHADAETGTVCWPDGPLAPDTLYERVRSGVWPDQSQAA